ncbi:MAG: hypothetical protein RR877_00920 [Aurantimicrobium sp.]|uniref:hypothetical protein n=1 Tax=Aurantimicrobium sp. TaxID=1930784 RepID=UPI002FC88F8E
MTKVVQRKANWISRKGHTALLIMRDSSIFGKSLITTPKMMQETDLEVGYIGFTSGLSELEQLGLLTRGDVRREYDNGMAPRTFKGSKSRLNRANYDRLCKHLNFLYTTYSVEDIAALATIAYLSRQEVSPGTVRWFTNEDYMNALREPLQTRKSQRSFRDAGLFTTYDEKTKRFSVSGHDPKVLNTLAEIDNLIEKHKPWNTAK